jgi:hypothetical protein
VFFTLSILVLSVALSQTGFTGGANIFKTFLEDGIRKFSFNRK